MTLDQVVGSTTTNITQSYTFQSQKTWLKPGKYSVSWCHAICPSIFDRIFFLDQLLFSLAKLVSLTIGLKIITGLGDYRLFLYPHYGKLGRTSSSCSSERKKDFWVRNILPKGLIGLLTKWPKKLPTCSNFCPFQKILLWANFDLLKYISIYIFVNENQKNYHGGLILSWGVFCIHVRFRVPTSASWRIWYMKTWGKWFNSTKDYQNLILSPLKSVHDECCIIQGIVMTKILGGERRRYVLAIKISEQLATIITCIVLNDPHVISILNILYLIARHFIEGWYVQIVFVILCDAIIGRVCSLPDCVVIHSEGGI